MVTLTKKTNTVEIVFSGSSTYLYDGTISAPLGSLVLITDQSDMATIRRAPSYDILFSAKIGDMYFGGTQATSGNINSLFDSTCGGNSGGGDMSNYYTKAETDAALSGKQNTLTAGSGVSISGDVISVTGGGTNVVTLTQAQYDALTTKDPGTIYVISDAPSAYYTKQEVDSAISGKANSDDVYSKAEIDQTNRVISEALHELHDEKADTSAVTASISAATSGKANSADVYTKTEVDSALSGKADTTAMTAAISAATSGKANSSDVYAKTDVDNAPTSGSTNLLTSGTLYNVLGDIDTALTNIIGGN